jgi:hypothetical protein
MHQRHLTAVIYELTERISDFAPTGVCSVLVPCTEISAHNRHIRCFRKLVSVRSVRCGSFELIVNVKFVKRVLTVT